MKLPKLYLWQLSPVLVSIVLFPLVWIQLGIEWRAGEQDLAHGFPALLAYLYILVHRPLSFDKNSPKINLLLSIMIGALVSFYALAEMVNIDVFTYAALFGTLPCLIALIFGWRTSLKLWHLHLFFVLPLPLWDGLLETLVNIASVVCSNFMRIFDLPMLIEGNSITIPSGRILIAEGCSGIRYFLVSIILGYILANLNGHYGWRMVLTVTCGALLGLLANWVRIILLIFIGYYTEMQSSLMADHESFGWVVFAAFCLPALYFAPQRTPTPPTPPFFTRPTFRQSLMLLGAGVISTLLVLWLRTPPETNSSDDQNVLAHWTPTADLMIAGVQAPTVPFQSFEHKRSSVKLTRVTHQRKTAEDKLVPFFFQSRVGDRWFLANTGELAAKVVINNADMKDTSPATQNITLATEEFKSLLDNTRVLSVQVFVVGDQITSSYSWAKLFQFPALLKRNNHFAYYLLQASCNADNCDEAKTTITQALQQLYPEVN